MIDLEKIKAEIETRCLYAVKPVEADDNSAIVNTRFLDRENNRISIFVRKTKDGDGYILDDGGIILAELAHLRLPLRGKMMRKFFRHFVCGPGRKDVKFCFNEAGDEWIQREIDNLNSYAFDDFVRILVILSNIESWWFTRSINSAPLLETEKEISDGEKTAKTIGNGFLRF